MGSGGTGHVVKKRKVFMAVAFVVILAGGAAASLITGQYMMQRRQAQKTGAVDEVVDGLVHQITTAASEYGAVLDGTAAFFAGSSDVTRTEFRAYFDRLQIVEKYPGMQGLGLTIRVTAPELDGFLAKARADGAPDFHVSPPGARPEYALILFNEPASDLAGSWGADAATSAGVRLALDRARDTGLPALTSRVVLAVDQRLPQGQQPAAFVLYVPIYRGGVVPPTVEQRRADLVGWVSSPFRGQDFLDEVLRTADAGVGLSLYDGTVADRADRIAFRQPADPSAATEVAARRTIEVHGRTWTLEFTRPPSAGWSPAAVGSTVVASGLLATMLVVAFLGVLVRSADRELEASERLTNDILGATQEAFISVDASGRITAWNAKAEVLFGWPVHDVLGQHVVDVVVPPEDRAGQVAALRTFIESSDHSELDMRMELTGMHRNGTTFPLELAIWATDERGTMRISAFLHDISERVRHQEELAAARDEAMKASELKSGFLANMSHEIRTPMNGVLGMASLLAETDLDPWQQEFVQTIRTSGDALLGIINDILDLSKIEAGKLVLERVTIDLWDAVSDVAEMLAVTASGKGVEVVVDVDPSVPRVVEADPVRLRQVLTNLVGNAVKFTDAGEIRIGARVAEHRDESPAVVRLEVEDTGIGIPQDRLTHIFEPFAQADATTTRRYGGTGLGLTITRQLIELMGGTGGVQSSPGRGSTFWFTLPVEAPARPVPPEMDLQGVHVLVVDDSATVCRTLARMLTYAGAEVATAGSSRTAIDLVRSRSDSGSSFDVALVDAALPVIDGSALAGLLAAHPAMATTPTVLTTTPGSAGKGPGAGDERTTHLPKPIRPGRLLEHLGELLHRGTTTAQPPAGDDQGLRPGIDRGGTARVLLAEDNVVNQRVATVMLRGAGYEVVVASDGLAAVREASSSAYDVILMDCHMPAMDGYEATARIRSADGPNRFTSIVALTADAMAETRDQCLAAGMDDFLSKPLDREQLIRTVAHWASHPRARA